MFLRRCRYVYNCYDGAALWLKIGCATLLARVEETVVQVEIHIPGFRQLIASMYLGKLHNLRYKLCLV